MALAVSGSDGPILADAIGSGQLVLAVALLARQSDVTFEIVREALVDRDADMLGLVLRAGGLDRAAIARIVALLLSADPVREAAAAAVEDVIIIDPERGARRVDAGREQRGRSRFFGVPARQGSMIDPVRTIRASVDAAGRLTEADIAWATLNARAGGAIGQPIALAPIAMLVRLAAQLGVLVSRAVTVADEGHDVDLWMRTISGSWDRECWRPASIDPT